MSAVFPRLARVLSEVLRLGAADAHLGADGRIRCTFSDRFSETARLDPQLAVDLLGEVTEGDSRVSWAGEDFRLYRGPDFLVIRHLYSGAAASSSSFSPSDFVPAPDPLSTAQAFVAPLVAELSGMISEATRAALAQGDVGMVAELDQAGAALREAVVQLFGDPSGGDQFPL